MLKDPNFPPIRRMFVAARAAIVAAAVESDGVGYDGAHVVAVAELAAAMVADVPQVDAYAATDADDDDENDDDVNDGTDAKALRYRMALARQVQTVVHRQHLNHCRHPHRPLRYYHANFVHIVSTFYRNCSSKVFDRP